MDKNVVFIGPSIDLPNLVNVNYNSYSLYKLKSKTWEKKFNEILNLVSVGRVDGIIIYMPTSSLLQASEDIYSSVFVKFLSRLDGVKAIFIAYEENLYENFNYYDYELEEYIDKKQLIYRISRAIKSVIEKNEFGTYLKSLQLDEQNPLQFIEDSGIGLDFEDNRLVLALRRVLDFESKRDQVSNFISQVFETNISVVPFKDKLEIRTRIQDFIFGILKEVFFSIFIKKSQIFNEEFETFIKIFEMLKV